MIKFECDNCKKIVDAAEMTSMLSESPFVWGVHGDEVNVWVQLTGETKHHFCHECMWNYLYQMCQEIGPEIAVTKSAVMEVPNEPEDADRGSKAADIVLPLMHAEGHLPEPGADVYPEDDQSPGSKGTPGTL